MIAATRLVKNKYGLFLCLCLSVLIFYGAENYNQTPDLVSLIRKKIGSAYYFYDHSINDMELPWWEMEFCNLNEPGFLDKKEQSLTKLIKTNNILYSDYVKWKNVNAVNHTCGWKSWNAGYGQKVISLCLYGNKTEYWRNIDTLLSRAVELYPGWYIRIYTTPSRFKKVLCPLLNIYPNLHICDITSLPPPLGNISRVQGSMWRFAPLSDILVDTAIFRDSDAMMLQREVDAVYDWLKSNKSLHVMRDHPVERGLVLAGMFGAHIMVNNRMKFAAILHKMFMTNTWNESKVTDQNLLKSILWPEMEHDTLQHDSYNCGLYPSAIPYPTQRIGRRFIGNRELRVEREETIRMACPEKCRPKNHMDWEFC